MEAFMEEDVFNNNLADINEIFNNKTLRYRINGFAYACNMHDIGVVGDSGVLFNSEGFSRLCNKRNKKQEHSYYISVSRDDNSKRKSVTLSGHYDDLFFTFVNYYNKERLDKKIIDLPFFISLQKIVDDETYEFIIKTVNDKQTQFSMTKYTEYKGRILHDDFFFYANVMDFSEILKLVKSFVYNPKLGFDAYNEIMEKQHIVFTNNMLNKMAMQDTKLDKPVGKIKKIVKRITNNH